MFSQIDTSAAKALGLSNRFLKGSIAPSGHENLANGLRPVCQGGWSAVSRITVNSRLLGTSSPLRGCGPPGMTRSDQLGVHKMSKVIPEVGACATVISFALFPEM